MFKKIATCYSFRRLSVVLVGIQQNEQLILSIFRQPLHVSSVTRPIIRRYNRVFKKIATCYSFRRLSVVLVGIQQNEQLILSIFRQPLHVSSVSRPIIRRYNRVFKKIATC